jgi:hypothetical protein
MSYPHNLQPFPPNFRELKSWFEFEGFMMILKYSGSYDIISNDIKTIYK